MNSISVWSALSTIIFVTGCGSASDRQSDVSSDAIVNGTKATAYPEAALIDMGEYSCSGAVIAPQVVLTAGHCVVGMRNFDVNAPYANNQKAKGSSSDVYDFRDTGEAVDGHMHDIALIYLKTRIELDHYPKLSSSKLPAGSTLINIGRVKNDELAHHNLFTGRAVRVRDASDEDFPFDYASSEVIQSGDSGGPCVVPGSADHEIAAVNSASADGEQVLARTDLLHSWIQQKIAAHGGGGFESDSNGGNTNPPDGECQNREVEPNESGAAGTALDQEATSVCGAIAAGGDQDWFTFSIADAGVSYAIELTASGDATLTVQKQVATGWKTLQSDGKRVANTSTSGGTYRIGVQSPSSTAQTYTLHLQR